MSDKGFLKNGNNTILPITRAELVLDADGNVALQSEKFAVVYDSSNADNSKYGLMSPQDKQKLDGLTIKDAKLLEIKIPNAICTYDGSNAASITIGPEEIGALAVADSNVKVHYQEVINEELTLQKGANLINGIVQKISKIYLNKQTDKYINQWMLQFTPGSGVTMPDKCHVQNEQAISQEHTTLWAFGESPTFISGKLYEIIFTQIGGGKVTASWVRYQ